MFTFLPGNASVYGFSDQYSDALIYVARSIPIAIFIRYLSKRHSIFFFLHVTGVITHELAHFFMGLLTGARPASFSIIPRRHDSVTWTLGSVGFKNLRWYNAAPVALAPILTILLPFMVAYWRTLGGRQFETIDFAITFAIAPQFLSFWPSNVDWKLSMRSWPYLFFGMAWWAASLKY